MTLFKIFIVFLFFFAAQGNASAQTSFSASKDDQEKTLFKYLNASAVCSKMTDANALYERGMLLISDKNDESYLAAADCFTSAAMKNHTPSQLELGKMYENGNGVFKSNVYAYKWYQTAVLLGNKTAVSYRDKLEARMSLDEISLANPMIQSTLNLIDSLNDWEEKEIEAQERKIYDQYKKFGIDLKKFEEKEEKKKTSGNPLMDALIQEQKRKAEDLKKQKAMQKLAEEARKAREQQNPGAQQQQQQNQQQQLPPWL